MKFNFDGYLSHHAYSSAFLIARNICGLAIKRRLLLIGKKSPFKMFKIFFGGIKGCERSYDDSKNGLIPHEWDIFQNSKYVACIV